MLLRGPTCCEVGQRRQSWKKCPRIPAVSFTDRRGLECEAERFPRNPDVCDVSEVRSYHTWRAQSCGGRDVVTLIHWNSCCDQLSLACKRKGYTAADNALTVFINDSIAPLLIQCQHQNYPAPGVWPPVLECHHLLPLAH